MSDTCGYSLPVRMPPRYHVVQTEPQCLLPFRSQRITDRIY
ncbi:hypothetical protein K788_0001520 (plasmid) [Paraburkholderia caribensis MBA4]|uniref:Uncharacterized protein n=1 Tax=Paraburkholderia caribensis MBA4 TaxID=1323664 RepID=A0A0N7JVT7_9BURK|nr:hypothetical protein K788_0001520 [Paraburkholderia caribensis MBA4]